MDFKQMFREWPQAIPKSGTVATAFGSSIPFSDFALNKDLVLLCRSTPDAQGTLREIIRAEDIVAVKFNEPIQLPRFLSMGFQKSEDAIASSFA